MRFLGRQKVKIAEIQRPPWYQESEYDEETLAYLRSSLETHGFFDPIFVRKTPDGKLWLVDGWHRIKVWQEKGNDEIEADVYEMSDEEYLTAHTSTQIAKGRPNPLKIAHLVKEYLKMGKSEEEVAKIFGKNVKWVRLYNVISEMPERFQDALSRGQLSIGVIEAALPLERRDEIEIALDYARMYKYTIEEMRRYVQKRKEELRMYQEMLEKRKMAESFAPKTNPEVAFYGKCSFCEREIHSMYLRGGAFCPDCMTILQIINNTFGDPLKALEKVKNWCQEEKEREEYERLKAKFEAKSSNTFPEGKIGEIYPPYPQKPKSPQP
jgi:ParB family chromosome partitioning protein